MSSLIGNKFPPELLLEILGHLVSCDPQLFDSLHMEDHAVRFRGIISATSICGAWRRLAIEDTSLWQRVPINSASTKNLHILDRILHRSKDRPITELTFVLGGDLDAHQVKPVIDVVMPHLSRCELLLLCMREYTCATTTMMLNGAAAVEQEPEPLPIGFWLPSMHQLRECIMYGFALLPTSLPQLDRITIGVHCPNMVVGGGLNRHLFSRPRVLIVDSEGICVPLMGNPTTTAVVAKQSETRLGFLVLENLRATPSETGEYDCAPFFRALDTFSLYQLKIINWHPTGRLIPDFLHALNQPRAMFPKVVLLFVSGVQLSDTQEATATLLGAFPQVRYIKIHNSSWWEEHVIRVLEMFSQLCPKLRQVRGEDRLIRRPDGLPFPVYEHCWEWELEEYVDGAIVFKKMKS
ncbi:hypothetical protein FB45DRAFT_1028959 [Roridomyces roridus]|uniref:F-box domain-containing protein n=1 Tax=Roridomyces roridus TaxID=1738132 RepID=A0AAD7FN25_9AGAR|nr:hypothetical protein FB45DRAFT_1028959 [Roridomyces roridus]